MSTTIHWSYILYRWQQIMTVQTQDSICYLNNDIRLSDRLICAKFRIEYKGLFKKSTLQKNFPLCRFHDDERPDRNNGRLLRGSP